MVRKLDLRTELRAEHSFPSGARAAEIAKEASDAAETTRLVEQFARIAGRQRDPLGQIEMDAELEWLVRFAEPRPGRR
jgi:hypothetical protein